MHQAKAPTLPSAAAEGTRRRAVSDVPSVSNVARAPIRNPGCGSIISKFRPRVGLRNTTTGPDGRYAFASGAGDATLAVGVSGPQRGGVREASDVDHAPLAENVDADLPHPHSNRSLDNPRGEGV